MGSSLVHTAQRYSVVMLHTRGDLEDPHGPDYQRHCFCVLQCGCIITTC